jgi:hypothetical protein
VVSTVRAGHAQEIQILEDGEVVHSVTKQRELHVANGCCEKAVRDGDLALLHDSGVRDSLPTGNELAAGNHNLLGGLFKEAPAHSTHARENHNASKI